MNNFSLRDDSQTDGFVHQLNPTWVEKHGISPLVFAFLTIVAIFFLYQIVGGLITLLLFGMKPLEENLTEYRAITGIGQILFILLPTVLFVRLISNQPKDYLRINRPKLMSLFLPIIGIISLQPMLQIYMVFQDRIPMPQEVQSIVEKFRDMIDTIYRQLVSAGSLSELLSVTFIVAIIPAFSEELMFRGLIQRTLEKSLSPLAGALVTGIIFAAYHLNPFSFIPLAAIGIYLGYITMRSGSIWVPIAAHFVNNALACITLYYNIKDDYVFVGNAGEMSTTGLLATFWFFGLIFLISTMYFIKLTKNTTQPPGPDASSG